MFLRKCLKELLIHIQQLYSCNVVLYDGRSCEHCKDCPNRLFNTGRTIEVGIGTITSNTLIIIPRTYGKEKRDKFINILKAMWLDVTQLLEQAYVTYDIKCPCYF